MMRLLGAARIEFEDVGFAYGRAQVLQSVSFELATGELGYLVGPSASGKTTLLRLAHGQLRPRSGRLLVAGVPLHRPRRRQLRELRRSVGVVFQDYRLLARLTALENVAYALRVADLRLHRGQALQRAVASLMDVGLGDALRALPAQLSGGQQQRVAIARALALSPRILLADEPTASLDDANAEYVLRLLEHVAESGTTVLIATCDRDLVGAAGRRILRLRRGEIVEDCLLPHAWTWRRWAAQ